MSQHASPPRFRNQLLNAPRQNSVGVMRWLMTMKQALNAIVWNSRKQERRRNGIGEYFGVDEAERTDKK